MADRRGRRLRIAALYIVALVLGVASAWLWLTRVGIAGVDAGIWRVNLLAGSTDADAYTRARIALAAVLALDRSETLYYTTDRDDTGALLRAECTYRLQGTPPPARWWSVTAYAADHFLFANEQRRYSVSGDTATIDEDGRFSALLGPTAPSDPLLAWIPTTGRGGMRLTLRLYGPDARVQEQRHAADAAPLRP